MQTKLNQILSFLTAFVLIAIVAMPSMSYATNEIEEIKTTEDNVEFNVQINGGKEATLNLSEKSNIDVDLNVLNTGYIKEATLTVENNNYIVENTENQYINKIENNVITLNQVNAGEKASIKLPIEFNKVDKVNPSLFDQESKITLHAIYVNEVGKEKKIQKSYNLKVKWVKDDATATINQKLVRYLNYDTNKTMLSFEVTAGVTDNSIPATSERIGIKVPTINNQLPKNVIVTGDEQTNNYENGILTINTENKVDEDGKIIWDSQRTFMVTYIYETDPVLGTLTQIAGTKITTISGNEISANSENNDFAVESEVGSIVEFKEEGTDSLSKGYLISNLNKTENKLETTYSENYIINVGLSSSIDKINLNEEDSQFINEEGKTILSATDKIENKKITINKDELIKVLGDEGRITVTGADGNEIGKLTSETTELDLANTTKISFETSKPKSEGNITVKVDKAIVGDLGLDKDTINSISTLKTKIAINGTFSNTVISTKEIEKDITLTNPTSKVGISLSKDTLSTVEENKNVVINIVLKTNSIDDALFENPTLHITLPEEVVATKVTEAQVLYDNELQAGTIKGTANTIDLTVNGKQTDYASSTITDGALIRLNTNLTLDNTAVSDIKSIAVDYTNASTGEKGESSHKVKIVAPSDFVTTNTVTVGDKTETAVEGDNKTISVKENDKEQNVEVSQTIVNNLGTDANGVTILGVLPSAGNKTVEGEDLQSTTGAELTSEVNVEGQDDAKVYYSTNNNESVDSSNWTENYTSDAKSYKVTTSSAVPAKKAMRVRYSAKLPANLGYDQSTSETYGVYYNNESDSGLQTNLVTAKSVMLKTASKPSVTMTISPIDTNEGYAISENGTVKAGEYITYNVKVTNSGSQNITNAKVKMTLPTSTIPDEIKTELNNQGITINDEGSLTDLQFIKMVAPGENSDFYEYYSETNSEKTITIDSLAAGETKVISFDTQVIKNFEDTTDENNENSDENTIAESNESSNENTTEDSNETSREATGVNEINPEFTLNYDNGTEQTYKYSNKLESANLSGKLSINSNGKTFVNGDIINFQVDVESETIEKQSNVELKVKVPDGMEYVQTESTYQYQNIYDIDNMKKNVSYDDSTRTITCKLDDLAMNDKDLIIFSMKVATSDDKDFKIKGTITSDKEKEGYTTNTAEIKALKSGSTPEESGFSVKQSTNLQNNTCYDTDEFKIYVDIQNNSGESQYVKYNSIIPSGLYVKNYTITLEGKQISQASASDLVNATMTMPANSTARVVIEVKPSEVLKGTTSQINIQSELELIDKNITTATSNLTIYIKGTGDNTANVIDNNNINQKNGTFIIGGKIFNDVNNNGKEDEGESPVSGVKVRIIDSQTRETVKNSQGNLCETTSSQDGTYSFNNLNTGNYIVIAEYDTSKYTVGIYKVEGATEDENNDFIAQTIDGQAVAATNIITPTKNEYNIDLALVNMDTFDLRLNKIVSKVTVVNSKNKNGNKVYNYNNQNAKVELSAKNLNSNNVLIEYKIQVINEGNVPGYASSIMDKIPEGLTFNSELNTTWYMKDKNAYNQTLANTLINPGETKEVTLILTKKITNDNMGSFNNVAEIEKSYNEYSIEDIDSKAGNMQDGEDDQSNALVTILIGTGRTIMKVSIITIAILGSIGLAVYIIKKRIIKE